MEDTALTPERRRRIAEAIAECTRFIDREEKRDPALRPATVQDLLDGYKAHRERMTRSLKENRLIPKDEA